MNNSGKQQSYSDREVDDQQQSNDDSSPVSNDSGEVSSSAGSGDSLARRNRNDIGLAARLTDLFVGDGDRDTDLLMQGNTQAGTVVQWLQALDMQVVGACRADERLKPLLKLNVSSVAEDRLLSHLSQHFEPSEVGLLARCLCIPLVSVRVGKINKQGTLLVPTSARGNLVLSLLPTSDLRISYIADDGYAERLSILRNTRDCSSVVIEGIAADSSGRSFAIRVPNRDPFYFWCSEKSRLLGNELLEKMKNLLERKPSVAELTGISDSRLQCFVDHLRTYLVGSTSVDGEVGQSSQSSPSKPSRSRSSSINNSSNSIQGSLSPRPSCFKEGIPRNLASLRNVVRDKLRRRAEAGRAETSEKHPPPPPPLSTSNDHEKSKLPETCFFPSLSGLEADKAVDMPSLSSAPQIPPIASSLFSPYYCWCPPVVSTLQYTVTPSPASSTESFTLPPLSSLLATSAPRSSSLSSLTPKASPNLSEIPPFVPLPSSQQIPMFTPLMCQCEPIVHIDICSSGQAYLVSAATAMSVTIPPLVQETDSDKSARDTLRLLISGSSQFPSILANTDAGGSRGFYGTTTDVNMNMNMSVNMNMNVNAIANSIAAMGLVTPGVMRSCIEQGDLVDLLQEQVVDAGGTCLNEDDGSGEAGTE